MLKTGIATIRRTGPPESYTKYEVVVTIRDNGSDIVSYYNINADVVVPEFSGEGLTVTFNELDDMRGSQPFSGVVGQHKIRIQTSKGIIIEGVISGGPSVDQLFTGSGSWPSP